MLSMSVQKKKEKEITDIEQTLKDKNLSSNKINIDNCHFDTSSSSFFSHGNYNTSTRNFDDLIYNQQTIKTMIEIKYNYMEEHKNIINTYYSIYSKRLDEIFNHNLNNLSKIEKHSDACNTSNQNIVDNQFDSMKIIHYIVDKNIDTFIKSLELANKFYFDVFESYRKYIRNFKNLNDK